MFHSQIYDEASRRNWTSHDLVMVVRNACLLILLTRYIDPPNCVHYNNLVSVEQLIKFEDIVQSLSNKCLCGVCSSILIELHTNKV